MTLCLLQYPQLSHENIRHTLFSLIAKDRLKLLDMGAYLDKIPNTISILPNTVLPNRDCFGVFWDVAVI
ncbi:MAG: hypothetical protein DRH15_04685 [Deltaproteobacteria bacterium]|nr:MAG: hypothetical protein DRH15_04685 [Deltaproteobacteria bacterium]